MRKSMAALFVVAAVFMSALPASAASQRVYFQCSSLLANMGGAPASWTPSAPTGSLSDGSGCAYGDAAAHNTTAGMVSLEAARFAGTFTGTLGALNVRLDTVPVGGAQTGGRVEFDLTLKVDGRDALGGPRRVSVQPVIASSGRFHSYYFSVSGLPYTAADENRLHSIEVAADIVNQPAVTWVYGAREVPSGIDFNPVGTHPVVIYPPGVSAPEPAPAPTTAPEPSEAPTESPGDPEPTEEPSPKGKS